MLRLHFSIDGEEQIVPLSGRQVHLGRGGENDIVLSDFSVSRRHAAIRSEPDGWYIYDLNSTNGVQVNQVSVTKGPIRPGDRVRIGVFEILVQGDDAEATAARDASVAEGSGSGISAATIVRTLDDFSSEFLPISPSDSAVRLKKRKALDQAYSNRIFSVLTKLARDLIETDTIDEVLARVMEMAFETLPVDRGFILMEQEGGRVTCELARVGEQVEYRPKNEAPISQTILERVMKDRLGLLTFDAQGDQRLASGHSIRIHGIRAAMCVPLWSEDKIIGFMQVDSPFQTGTFTEQDLEFLITLANYTAVAVERIRERRARARLERYHSPAVIDEVMRGDETVAGVQRLKKTQVTVLFADLVGFTAFSEASELEEVAELLKGYCTRSVEAIFAQGGTLDKFIGDCVMAFFGAPMDLDDHALRGARAAMQIQDAMDAWNALRTEQGLPEIHCRIALNSGPVVVGDVGSERRVDYTVLGNTVNVAARLEDHVAGPGQIVLGEATRKLLGDRIDVEPLGSFALKGLQQQVTAFRVVRESRDARS